MVFDDRKEEKKLLKFCIAMCTFTILTGLGTFYDFVNLQLI